MGAMKEKYRQQLTTRRQEQMLAISQQYGLSMTKDADIVRELYQAEDQSRICAGCVGECKRRHHRFQSPMVKQDPWRVEWEDCPQVQRVITKRQMEASRILPFRYADKDWQDYDLTMGNHQAVEFASQFDGRQGLYISGKVGVGKTFLASLIAKNWILQGKEVIFGSVPALMTRLQAKFNVGSEAAELLLDYVDCSLLILDDFGTGNQTKWKLEKLFEIIDGRYNLRRPLIITSNLSLENLPSYFGLFDKDMGDKLTSRLGQMCKAVEIRGSDRRQHA